MNTMELYSLSFANGKRYIGISKDAHQRLRGHKSIARKGSKLPLYAAIRKCSKSDETRAKISATKKGKPWTAARRAAQK